MSLLWHLIWTANVEPKTSIDVSKNVFNFWIRPPILDNLRRLHPLSPEGGSVNKPLGSWGVNCGDAHAYLQLSDINIRLWWKRSTICIFTFVSPMGGRGWGILHYWALGKLNSMGSWCTILSNSMGSWCLRKLNSMGGWVKKKVPSSSLISV